MGMPVTTAPQRRRRPAEATRSIIPERICLHDGREFLVRDLLVKPRDRRSYNLKTGQEFGQRIKRKITKDVDTTDTE